MESEGANDHRASLTSCALLSPIVFFAPHQYALTLAGMSVVIFVGFDWTAWNRAQRLVACLLVVAILAAGFFEASTSSRAIKGSLCALVTVIVVCVSIVKIDRRYFFGLTSFCYILLAAALFLRGD